MLFAVSKVFASTGCALVNLEAPALAFEETQARAGFFSAGLAGATSRGSRMHLGISGGVKNCALSFALSCLVLLAGVGGCASRKDVDMLQRQIWSTHRELKAVDSRVAELEKTVEERLKELAGRIEADSQPIRRNQAATGAQLDRLELDLGRLSGELEEMQLKNSRQGERISKIQQEQTAAMLEIQKKLAEFARRLNQVARSLGLEELAAEPGEMVAAPVKESGESQQTAAPEKQEGEVKPEELYSQAFQLFRAGDYQAAKEKFGRYLELYPDTDLADNAQFWLGECYYAEEKYSEAIAAYEKTIKQYPQSDKVSSALLKEGMAFVELGDEIAAKILLKKVIKEYPESNQAQIAQSRLNQIK